MNFGNGDSLISLPFEDTINYLATRFKKELSELSKLRCEYLNNPANPSSVEKIENIKQEIRNNLDLEFNKFLSYNSPVERKAAKKIDLTKLFGLTKPFYWCLEFWFVYFDEKGEPLSPKESG
jgi:hypothetical protein